LEGALGPVRSCLVVADGSTAVYGRAPDLALAPASTQKLLVAAAALDQLGPDFRFVTTVVAPAAPQGGGVDALWLVGAGDPMLATPDYAGHVTSQPRTVGAPLTPMTALADAVAAAGVRNVKGGVHGDDSRYDRLRWLPGWKPIYRDEADISPLSALTVNGGLDHWDPTEVVTADPTGLATVQLTRLLGARGVSAAAGEPQTRPGTGVVLGRVASAPLSQIVSAMLRSSDNLAAELIVRELDRHGGGAGTTAGGLQVVAATAQRLGIPIGGLHQGDGSGLDPSDRASCLTLLGALQVGDRPGFGSITEGLAVAARSGTLVHRFGGTPLAGTLSAKTGWIDCAAGMIGRLNLARPVRFALLVNGPCNYDAAEAIENRVALALATYPN
jgi:D-alanyl-D-alanine carboxypeptidase/D-alanyl-D-alanine-endopeptidase (penicillin-binding protein 4)